MNSFPIRVIRADSWTFFFWSSLRSLRLGGESSSTYPACVVVYRRMDDQIRKQLVPGAKVKVTQQIAARHYALPAVVRGTVVRYGQKETGSWFAHSRDDRLWLDRLVLRKDDGEITTLNLDEYSHVEIEPSTTKGT